MASVKVTGKDRRKVRRYVYDRLATLPRSKQPCCCVHELVVTMIAEERKAGAR